MNERTSQTTAVIKVSIAVAIILTLAKLAVGFMSHSMSVFASALDSAMDVGVSSVNLFAARFAGVPPDKEHTYGHGKIESLAGLFQSMIIGVSGFYIAFESFKRLVCGSVLRNVPVAVGVMFFSMVLTWGLVVFLRRSARKNPSLILDTESLHFTTDLLSNLGVMLALLLVRLTGYVFWDLLLSLMIAFYILRASLSIFRRSVDELLDRSLPPASLREIKKLVHHHDSSIVGLHRLRSRRVGEKVFLDFHIEIEGQKDFKRAHALTESLVSAIQKRYPESDVTVHFDPEGER